jgi:hypothetical protein
MHEEAVKLYVELVVTAMASFISSKDAPLMELVQLNVGFEECRETLKKFRGEDDDDFQFLEYHVFVATLALARDQDKGVARLRAYKPTRESYHMLPGVQRVGRDNPQVM